MPLAGAVPSAAILLLVVLSAEGQPFKGLVPKNGSVGLIGNNVTATADAAAMCYQRSVVDEEARLSKTVVDVTPLAVCLALDDARLLPRPLLLNDAASVPSPASARQFVPPSMPADAPAPTPGASPEDEDKKGLSGRAKAWCCWALAAGITIVIFVVRPETPMIYLTQTLSVDDASVVDGNGDGDGELFDCAICMETVPGIGKFSAGSCGHAFCSGCVAQYVAAKLGENVARVKCPDPGCEC
ncbi:hypothetical protein ACQJBY_008853 [Aegilops geniculata]